MYTCSHYHERFLPKQFMVLNVPHTLDFYNLIDVGSCISCTFFFIIWHVLPQPSFNCEGCQGKKVIF